MSLSRNLAMADKDAPVALRLDGAHSEGPPRSDANGQSVRIHAQMKSPLITSCIEDVPGFRSLRTEWETLYRRCASATPFNSWDWLFSWWQSYGASRHLRILTCRRDGELVGVLPLYRCSERHWSGMSLRSLRFVGDGSSDSDYLGWIVAPEHQAECSRSLIAWLKASRDWDALVLREMSADSPLPIMLRAACGEHRWPLRHDRSLCGVLDLPGSFDEFLQARQSRFRTKLRALLKRLDQGEIVFETEASSRTLRSKLRSLFSLHQQRWQEAGQPGVFGMRSKRSFYARFCPRYARKGWLRLYSLRDADRYLAHQLCFEDRGVVYLLQEGFDVSDPSASYGQMLRASVIRHLIDSGTKRYDFLGGYSQHKIGWGAEEQPTVHLVAARRSLRGLAYFHEPQVRAKCAAWAESHLPARLVAWLKRTLGAHLPR